MTGTSRDSGQFLRAWAQGNKDRPDKPSRPLTVSAGVVTGGQAIQRNGMIMTLILPL